MFQLIFPHRRVVKLASFLSCHMFINMQSQIVCLVTGLVSRNTSFYIESLHFCRLIYIRTFFSCRGFVVMSEIMKRYSPNRTLQPTLQGASRKLEIIETIVDHQKWLRDLAFSFSNPQSYNCKQLTWK